MSSLSKILPFLILYYLPMSTYGQSTCELLKGLAPDDALGVASSIPPPESLNGTPCLNQIGQFLLKRSNVNQAIPYFERALQFSEDSPERATILNQLAIAYKNIGNTVKAIHFMESALDLIETSNDQEKLAAAYNDYGLVLSGFDDDKALKNYEQALLAYKSLSPAAHQRVAQTLINIGIIYRGLEFYGDALYHFEEAQKIASQLNTEEGSLNGFVVYNLGQTYYEMRNDKLSRSFFEQALDLYQAQFNTKHPDVARTYNRLGNLHNRSGEFKEALLYYQKALQANSTANFSDIEVNPPIHSYLHAHTMLNSLYYKAQALEDYHFNFSLDFKDLKLSLTTLYSCDSLIDEIRRVATQEADKLALSELASHVYENGVRVGYAMAEVSFKKDEYLEHAFYFAEKSKSAVLLQAISDASAKSYANIPSEKLKEEGLLKNEISYYEQQIAEGQTESNEFRSSLFHARQQYESFIRELEENYPQYYDLKYNVTIPGMKLLQQDLDEDEGLFSYFIEDTQAKLYIFQISKHRIKVDRVSLSEDFDRYINGFRNSLYFQDEETFLLTGATLFTRLFPSAIPNKIRHITVVPAGKLGTIPFEALLTERNKKGQDYSTYPYLIQQYSLGYQYTAALFHQQTKRSPAIHEGAALLCAPIEFTTLQNLPASGEEVQQLKSIFEEQGIRSDILLKRDATEESFKSKTLDNYRYLHLATHGTVNEFNPQLSRIYLTETASNDGNLYSGEIYNLHLKTELITLSACETGLGKISKGEGIIGLSRALIYAGAHNLVVSLWRVADASTSVLMTSFYGALEDNTYASGLQQAKLELINGEYSHPYYWAPFILIGK